MANKCKACASYCLLVSVAGTVLLTYLTFLSFYGLPEFTSKIESEKRGSETTETLGISAGIYLALVFICAFVQCRSSKKVDPMDYDPLPDR